MSQTPVSTDTNLLNLPLPFPKDDGNPYTPYELESPLFMQDPPNIVKEVQYNPSTGEYEFYEKIGDFQYKSPTSMERNEFLQYQNEQGIRESWREQSATASADNNSDLIPPIYVGGEAFDRIFGSNTIEVRPQGSAEVTFGVLANNREDPQLDIRQRRTVNFDFQQRIQMNVLARIGDKIEFKTNYNTEATFQFENRLELRYEGDEDDIIKLIEAGNVNLPLNTTLITGSQSLFGIKTKLQFGKTTVTAVFSQQEAEAKNITVQGGAQTNEFRLTALDYEENRHFFLSQFFRDNYQNALDNLPIIASDINITRVEVWVTNIGAAVEQNRNIIAFTDLGEGREEWIFNPQVKPIPGQTIPNNNSNDLLFKLDTAQIRDNNRVTEYLLSQGFTDGEDFNKVELARKLNSSEYTFNSKLGFISLNTTLNPNQTLAVAYQYTVIGFDTVFQVGEFSDQGIVSPNNLITKLLRSINLNVRMPMWDLMMKNVYNIGAYQVDPNDFIFNILYFGDDVSVPTGYFFEGSDNIKGIPLIHLFNLDNLNAQLNPVEGGDGIFDFINNAATQGGTFQSSNGRLFFTVLEPFGTYLRDTIFANDPNLADKYAYDSLYRNTKVIAEQDAEQNKYIFEGFYKSSSGSEISLNALNVPRGSVRVTAGGVPLTENVDYTVDYTLGRVRIINEGILNSGTPINISLESNTLFNIIQKRMMGIHIDHEISENFRIGGTVLNLHERPLTQKVNYGDDPISNTIWGLDLSYRTESRWLTRMVDKIPGISTKAVSRISVDGEFAHFLPGHSKAIGKTGTTYIDDFEGTKSTIDLRNVNTWFLASTPQGQFEKFPEASVGTGLDFGKNRSKLAWYIIDPFFYNDATRPGNISRDDTYGNYVRQIPVSEIFPTLQQPSGSPPTIPVFNLAYYPSERGPYNYDVEPVTGISKGLNASGELEDPESRWGGIMRRIETVDFEAANIEYLEFWMMDPFAEDSTNSGKMYINLGDISEDFLRDGRRTYENGFPTTETVENVDTTIWGRVPTLQALTESFDNAADSRQFQDIGYDGLRDEDELTFVPPGGENYLTRIEQSLSTGSQAYTNALEDPSGDNYQYFRGSELDSDPIYSSILERYKRFNGPEGNSPTDAQNAEAFPTAATTIPNLEDINRDNTLAETERYFQYEIILDKENMVIGQNYITDRIRGESENLKDNQPVEVDWYQFKIPLTQFQKTVGNIENFRSIRFMRMFFSEFERPVVCRFASLELVRGEWRNYRKVLQDPGGYISGDEVNAMQFDISSVNLNENSERQPIPYAVPPSIVRETNFALNSQIQLNEQSLEFQITDLPDGYARGAFKNTEFDFRQYKYLRMFVHAEKRFENQGLEDGDITAFIRMGADFTENYYEYEVPLKVTEWGTVDPDEIWPAENNFDINLEELVQVKVRRNIALRESANNVDLNEPYIEFQGENKITVIGNPTISDVQAILIGVRNPKKQSINDEDDARKKSAIVWINELRLTDFNTKGGWAATARVEAVLADFGRVSVSGAHSTPNFGSLEKRLTEVPLETNTSFDISTDLDLGKFFGEEAGVRIPMHFDYGETRVTPNYNPLNPDVKLTDDLETFVSTAEQDSLKNQVIDYTQRKNFNLINVRKDRVGGTQGRKPKIYDIENFNVTYSFQEIYHRDIDIEYERNRTWRGGFGYNFNANPKNVAPLSRSGLLGKSNYLALIKDFNFFYLPKLLGFRTDMNRNLIQKKYRDKSFGDIITFPIYRKDWTWIRNYDLKYDFSRSLTFEFNAGANSFISEPNGFPERGTDEFQQYRDSVWAGIFSLGVMQNYTQNFRANYNLPLRKIPIIDWVTATLAYGGVYTWSGSPLSTRDRLGNVIENGNTRQLNLTGDMVSFYNKIPYLQNINQKNTRRRGGPGGGPPGRNNQLNANQEDDSDTTKPRINYAKIIGDGALRLLMMFRRAQLNYSDGSGTLIPGYTPEPEFLGMTGGAPGLGFVFGDQRDIRADLVNGNYLTVDSILNQAYIKKYTESLRYTITVEPFNDFEINLDGDRTYSESFQAFYRFSEEAGSFIEYTPVQSGSFSITFGAWSSSFEQEDNDRSPVFEKFKGIRTTIAQRLADNNPNWNGEYVEDTVTGTLYPFGYTSNSQAVLYYSFLTAYSGSSPDQISITNPFPSFPIPNWRLRYNGLSRLSFMQNIFKSFTLTHGYRSIYSIGSWTTNVQFQPDQPDLLFENSFNYVTEYNITQVSIVEQWAPLIGFDMTFENSLSTRIEYKRDRNLSMSFVNNQLTEVRGSEILLGFGYRFSNVKINFISVGGQRSRTGGKDLNLRLDMSFRDSKTTLRRIDEDNNQISAGQRQFALNFSADYQVSQRFQIRLYFDRNVNTPYISNQFKTSTTRGGISLRFSLAQ